MAEWCGKEVSGQGMIDPKGTEAIKVMAQEKACEQEMGRWLTSPLNKGHRGVLAAKPGWYLAAPGDQGLYLVHFPKLPAGPQAHLPALLLVPPASYPSPLKF